MPESDDTRRPRPFGRRAFLAAAGAAAGGMVFASPAETGALGRARTVSIFHSTDLHGRILPTSTYEGLDDVGGFARVATCLRQWRRESPHSITVDVGDVVQGTAVSLHRGGNLMLELFNRLGYDAWTLGNHDFDWGPESLAANLAVSQAPVLTANLARDGKTAGQFEGDWAKVRSWTIREVGGFRIGLVGLITPGLPYWLPADLLGGVEPLDPVATLKRSVAEVRAEGVDAVVVMGHMGWRFNDDYANPVRSLLREGGDVDVYLAGHSHQNQPSWMLHGVVCSQASYHGIHCGRVDLTFDVESRKLVDRRAFSLLMDERFAFDPLVMELARPDLDAADARLAREVATVTRPIPGTGRDSDLARLLCDCFGDALRKQGQAVDAVFHGTFRSGDVPAGPLTVADCWKIIPYENRLVTAEVTAAGLMAILAEDAGIKDSDRTLWPLDVVRDDTGRPLRILLDGVELPPDRRLTLGLNAYDAQSGGRRLMQTREILAAPPAKLRISPIDTRTALIDGLLDRGTIG